MSGCKDEITIASRFNKTVRLSIFPNTNYSLNSRPLATPLYFVFH